MYIIIFILFILQINIFNNIHILKNVLINITYFSIFFYFSHIYIYIYIYIYVYILIGINNFTALIVTYKYI